MNIEEFLQAQDNRKVCTSCQQPHRHQIKWDELNTYSHEVEFCESLRKGKLMICKKCMSYWYLDNDFKMLIRVENIKDIRAWYDNPATLPEQFKQLVESFGGLENKFACRIKTKEGIVYEKALIHFVKEYPAGQISKADTILTMHDVEEITPSPYTFSKEIRYASYCAPERSMLFNPTVIGIPNGPSYLLEGTSHFWNGEKNKPEDFILGVDDNYHQKFPPFIEENNIPVFYAEWYEDIDLYEIGNPYRYFASKLNSDPTKYHTDREDALLTKSWIQNRVGFLVGTWPFGEDTMGLRKTLFEANLKSVDLCYNGIGFRETAEAFDNFNKDEHVGFIHYNPKKEVPDYMLEAKILLAKLRDLGGLFILCDCPELLVRGIDFYYPILLNFSGFHDPSLHWSYLMEKKE